MAKRIEAGRMRHTVRLQYHGAETTLDSYGQISASTTAWTTIDTMRAAIDPLRGEELELARQIYPLATHRVTIDYTTDLGSTGASRRRVVFGTRVFHIGGIVNPDEENFGLELMCGEER